MGSSPKKLIGAIANPVDAVISNNVSKQNALRQLWHPEQLSIARQNYDEGQPTTIGGIADQGGAWSKTTEQKRTIAAADAYAADAPNRAALAATQSANVSLRAKNLRRRASSLATGADTGGALLQTPTAYGKSSLGG